MIGIYCLPYRKYFFAASLAWAVAIAGCAPQRPYRPAYPRNEVPAAPRIPPPTQAPVPPPPVPRDLDSQTLPRESTIREQDIKPTPPPYSGKTPKDAPGQTEPGEYPMTAEPVPPLESPPGPLPDDSSLLAKITPGVSPQRAASLRLTDEGSKLLDAGEANKALARLERTIVIDSTNAYGYFYLAKAQFQLGRYRESLNFLSVAESRLRNEPFWLAEVQALRGENYRAQGQRERAEQSYLQALRVNSGNRTAADGLARLQVESPSASR